MKILGKHPHFNKVAGISYFNIFFLGQPGLLMEIKCFHMLLWKFLVNCQVIPTPEYSHVLVPT